MKCQHLCFHGRRAVLCLGTFVGSEGKKYECGAVASTIKLFSHAQEPIAQIWTLIAHAKIFPFIANRSMIC